jgi:hypothetical protein
MQVLLIRISLGLQMLSLPLLTPQVIGVARMDALRDGLKALVRPIAKGAAIVISVTFGVAFMLFAAPFFYAAANHTDVSAKSFHTYPGWAQVMVKIAIWGGAIIGGGGIALTLILGLVAGLLVVATRNPQGFFLLGGFVFALAIGLQLWATFYPAH